MKPQRKHTVGRYPNSKERVAIQDTTVKSPSFKTLINWNISKVVKNKPGIDLKAALKEAQERLEEAHDVKELMSADARNLCCALLAWQQLGHSRTDSLFNFVQQSLKEEEREHKQIEESLLRSSNYQSDRPDCPVIPTGSVSGPKMSSQWGSPYKMDFSTSIGLVVKLPAEPQTLMRVSGPMRVPINNITRSRGKPENDIARKIDKEVKLCYVDTSCLDRLTSIEVETQNLRKRMSQFAHREKERNEKLERAETAWRELDASYKRRLLLAKEKEEEYTKTMKSILNERNRYKEACVPLANRLKVKSEVVCKDEEALTKLEQEVCSNACARAQLAERAAQADTQLMETRCKASQLDRNLALKEEQQRHEKAVLQGEMEAAKMVTHEAEYALRSELQAQSAQVARVSQDLLEEDARAALLKKRVDDYMVEKNEIIEDLEACQAKCDDRMAALTKDLKTKRDHLAKLEDQVMECQCKEPVERAVQVKRTPSLVATCKCSPSEVGSCSCTSMRSRLFSSLLSNLFGGLKSEMETIGSQMPCHLLKCLEDTHNWDRNSDVKQNIRAYFSQLLLGELEIAIATVIENSHARWVGECCADRRKPPLLQDSKYSLRGQEHELDMRTQKLANELAEKMFREKAQELAMQAQEELEKSGHRPCECNLNDKEQYESAVYSCLVHPYPDGHLNRIKNDQIDPYKVRREKYIAPPLESTRLLKKDVNGPEPTLLNNYRTATKIRREDVKSIRPILKNSSNVYNNATTRRTSNVNARNPKPDTNKPNRELKTVKTKIGMYSSNKLFKGPQQYAVNMCLCDHKNDLPFNKSHNNFHMESSLPHSYKACDLCIRQQKSMLSDNLGNNSCLEREKTGNSNTERCTCLNKPPSNTSIDRLVRILNKWKINLGDSRDSNVKEAVNTDSLFKITHTSIVNVLQELSEQSYETDTKTNIGRLEKCEKRVNYNNSPHESKIKIDKKEEFSHGITSSELQINQSTLLIPLNNVLYNCIANVENGNSNANNQPTLPLSVKADIQSASIRNNLPAKRKRTQDSEINMSIKDNHLEIDFIEKTPVINIIDVSDPHPQGGEKYIQCLGVTLANAACKRSLTKTAYQKDHVDKKTQYQEQKNDSTNLHENEKKCINNCNLSNDQISFKEVGKNPPVNTKNSCESYIQFLGVAINNANENALAKRKTKKLSQSNNKKHYQDHVFRDTRNNNNGKSDNKMFKFCTNRYVCKPKCPFKFNKKTLDVVHVHNECVYPHRNVKNSNDNKSMQVETNRNDILSQEPCVCCQITKDDISNDLEVNAFQLLEEHLRSKLDEIRHSAGKSSYIQNVDEKSILGDTLLKVKKLIMESANTVTCKCAQCTHTSNGSWKRAYGLLEEYLKSKIEHVQCLCSSVEYSRDDNLVSQVLNEINCLIENDLQRLKDIWTSNDTAVDTNKYESFSTLKMQCITNKPGNCDNTIISNATDTNYKSTSKMLESKCDSYTSGDFLPQNKSAQALLRQLVESKSCDALKTFNKYSEVQTDTESDHCTYYADVTNESTKKIENEVNLHSKLQGSGFFNDASPFQTKDITVLPVVMSPNDNINENNSKKILSSVDVQFAEEKIVANSVKGEEKIEKPFMAYIGCTLNCCCDHDLGCVCTKSTLLSNTEWLKTNFIWNIFTQKQGLIKNVSYIQNSISNKAPNIVDSVLDVKKGSQLKETIQSKNRRESDIRPNVEKIIYPNRYKLLHLDDNYNKEDLLVVSKTRLCVSEVNASNEKHIYLKKSDQRLDIAHGAIGTNTVIDDYSIQGIPILPKRKFYSMLKRNVNGLLKNEMMPYSNSDTAVMTNHAFERLESFSKNCDCAMVPICHAKMLVENLANKLYKAECTCDSLKSVCPIHF